MTTPEAVQAQVAAKLKKLIDTNGVPATFDESFVQKVFDGIPMVLQGHVGPQKAFRSWLTYGAEGMNMPAQLRRVESPGLVFSSDTIEENLQPPIAGIAQKSGDLTEYATYTLFYHNNPPSTFIQITNEKGYYRVCLSCTFNLISGSLSVFGLMAFSLTKWRDNLNLAEDIGVLCEMLTAKKLKDL